MPIRSAEYYAGKLVSKKERLYMCNKLTPKPPNKINNEDTSVIPISGAFNSFLISGIPGNYKNI